MDINELNKFNEELDRMLNDEQVQHSFIKNKSKAILESADSFEEPEPNWYEIHNSSDVYYDITYFVPQVDIIHIYAFKEEDGSIGYSFDYPNLFNVPYKVQQKLPKWQHYKTVKEAAEAAFKYYKAVKQLEGVKLKGLKISEPYYTEK